MQTILYNVNRKELKAPHSPDLFTTAYHLSFRFPFIETVRGETAQDIHDSQYPGFPVPCYPQTVDLSAVRRKRTVVDNNPFKTKRKGERKWKTTRERTPKDL